MAASVVLATGYVSYGSSLYQNSSQQEDISVYGLQVWVNSTDSNGIGWGALGVRNDGERIVAVDTIQVKGIDVPIINWYVDDDQTRVTSLNFLSGYVHTGTDSSGQMRDSVDAGFAVSTSCNLSEFPDSSTLEIDFDESGVKPTLCLSQRTSPVSLSPGEEMIVYFRIPDKMLEPFDAGKVASVSVYAQDAGSPTVITIDNV
ncbi:MAG: hypothetical protein R3327_03645 [Nitrosopumilaceae archaeon]|nr:hypothetical protein [Nitrosopumilaceae archaeon]